MILVMIQLTVPISEHVRLARDTYRVRLECEPIATRIRPGQFVMLRLPRTTDPLLGRPFALYDIPQGSGQDAIDIVYVVIGKMTGRLAHLRVGEEVEIWGPLGKGFLPIPESDHVTLVAGGIGQTPFLAYARELLGARGYAGESARRRTQAVSLFYGVRSSDLAAGLDDFIEAGVAVHLATDDGSAGHPGLVTELLRASQPTGPLIACGPMPMMRAVAAIAREWGRPCQVSLETPMACGFGVCFSCVTQVKTTDGWDYRRVCMDGPVFDAEQLQWSSPIVDHP